MAATEMQFQLTEYEAGICLNNLEEKDFFLNMSFCMIHILFL